MENIKFTAGDRPYSVTGSGLFVMGGEVAVKLTVTLQLQVFNGINTTVCFFTNATLVPNRVWPVMDITVGQTNGTATQVYTLRLAAAPIRELWFSTVSGFTATTGESTSNDIEGGDLISTAGHVVKHNADFFTSVGVFPPVPELGLKAVDVLPAGEIAFALGANIYSSTLGQLQQGDLLSTRGRILRRNQELLAPFMPQPGTNDAGLDAVQVLDTGEILFSTVRSVFSKQLGTALQSGDLLSSTGTIVRSNQQLLARFHPPNATNDYGLQAVYVWPSGEIWFSPEIGFQDESLGLIQAGDLLSDQGYIVFRNLELLNAFAPGGGSTNLGLSALYVVTDATAAAPAPSLAITLDPSTGDADLSWKGTGRVFQVERAGAIAGPFDALSRMSPDLSFADSGAITNRPRSFYRLRQW